MDSQTIVLRRMQNLRLCGNPLDSPEDVVGRLGAVQSQDYVMAKWSVAQRTRDVDGKGIDEALASGAMLRTHVLRPTWHFVRPEDILWMLHLTSPRVRLVTAHYLKRNALDQSIVTRCHDVLVPILRDGHCLTRKEIASEMESLGISLSGLRLGLVLMEAELAGLICSGPMKGKHHTSALLEERAPQATRLTQDEALAELTLGYFTGHGPATAKDFSWWSSLTLSQVKRGLEMVGRQLAHEVIDGVSFWSATMTPGLPSSPQRICANRQGCHPRACLVHTYDELIVGYGNSKYVLDASGLARSASSGGTIYNPSVIVDGQIVGCWKRKAEKDGPVLEVILYKRLDDAQMSALDDALAVCAKFFGLPASKCVISIRLTTSKLPPVDGPVQPPT